MIQFEKSFFDEITKKKIDKLRTKAEPYFRVRNQLYQRYNRKTGINSIMSGGKDADGNARPLVAYEHNIVTSFNGYMTGTPPTYTTTDESPKQYQIEIDNIRRYNDDPNKFSKLMKSYLISRAAYLYVTEDPDTQEITYTPLDSRNTIVIYDYGTPPYPIALLIFREIETDDDKTEKQIEIITAYSRRIFDEKGNPIAFADYDETTGTLNPNMTVKPLYWGDVPVIAFEEEDGKAIFEPVIGLIDSYEDMLKNINSISDYNDKAKFVFRGFDREHAPYRDVYDSDGNKKYERDGITPLRERNPAAKTEDDELYKASTIFLNDENADAYWLIKNVSYADNLAVLEHHREQIALQAGYTDWTELVKAGAQSGVALRIKLYLMELFGKPIENVFREGYQRLWEIITNRLNLRGDNYDFRDIDIVFNRNIPVDVERNVTVAIQAYNDGLISLPTAIRVSGLDIDPEAEMERLRTDDKTLILRMLQGLQSGLISQDEARQILAAIIPLSGDSVPGTVEEMENIEESE